MYAILFAYIDHQTKLLKNLKKFADNLELNLDTVAKDNPFLIGLPGKCYRQGAKQCTLINKTSEIPATLNVKTTKPLSSIPLIRADIAKIIKNFDPNKARGHDIISKQMFRLCGDSALQPFFKVVRFPYNEKGDKQLLKSYRPISLLPICGKIFERLIYNKMFEYFIENGLISHNQSGFKRGDSCINQLLSTTHEIYKSFDSL